MKGEDRRRQALLDRGDYLRVWARSESAGVFVAVGFRNKDGDTKTFLMGRETYEAIPLGKAATPADFAKHGPLSDMED